jgi:hypothetical protein
MRLGITGTNTYENRIKIKNFMHQLKKRELVEDVTIISLGEKNGADKYVKKFALEFGFNYQEANLPHTPQTLYSMLSEHFYNKPYSVKNFFTRNKIYAQYIDKCVVFDETDLADKKIYNLVRALHSAKKVAVIMN